MRSVLFLSHTHMHAHTHTHSHALAPPPPNTHTHTTPTQVAECQPKSHVTGVCVLEVALRPFHHSLKDGGGDLTIAAAHSNHATRQRGHADHLQKNPATYHITDWLEIHKHKRSSMKFNRRSVITTLKLGTSSVLVCHANLLTFMNVLCVLALFFCFVLFSTLCHLL